jgi:hypothetical protein
MSPRCQSDGGACLSWCAGPLRILESRPLRARSADGAGDPKQPPCLSWRWGFVPSASVWGWSGKCGSPPLLSSAETVTGWPLFEGLKIKASWLGPCWGPEGTMLLRPEGHLPGGRDLTQLCLQRDWECGGRGEVTPENHQPPSISCQERQCQGGCASSHSSCSGCSPPPTPHTPEAPSTNGGTWAPSFTHQLINQQY